MSLARGHNSACVNLRGVTTCHWQVVVVLRVTWVTHDMRLEGVTTCHLQAVVFLSVCGRVFLLHGCFVESDKSHGHAWRQTERCQNLSLASGRWCPCVSLCCRSHGSHRASDCEVSQLVIGRVLLLYLRVFSVPGVLCGSRKVAGSHKA